MKILLNEKYSHKDKIKSTFKDVPVLESERLIYKKIVPENSADMFEYSCLEEVTRYLLWTPHVSLTQTERYIKLLQKKYDSGAFWDFGLTDKEADDFITYWLPLMQENPYNIISFQTDAYTDSAKLEVVPSPDTVIRVFMAYKASDEFVEIDTSKDTVQSVKKTIKDIEKQKEEIKLKLSGAKIFAPQDGIISGVLISQGDVVNPAEVLCTLIPKQVWILASVNAEDYSKISGLI